MNEVPREIPGASEWERAVNLAGLLAELGETLLVIESAAGRRELKPRETGLPGELVGRGGAVVMAPGSGLRFLVTPGAITRASGPLA